MLVEKNSGSEIMPKLVRSKGENQAFNVVYVYVVFLICFRGVTILRDI